jgi:hypothetical protein
VRVHTLLLGPLAGVAGHPGTVMMLDERENRHAPGACRLY